ncbi:YidC/Oxa1 family membrane protein insertase, partial [Candidatus Roizmanbacteria bacterium]|nr:YidC/Oxa1 family membrane protein insertase [Candidatus Roizmanbacteria bacterium]
DPWFFGINLALTPAKAGQWYYYLVPVVTAFLQYLQTTSMTPPSPATSPSAKGSEDNSKNKQDSGDFQKAMNTQMKFIFPLMIGWFSYTLPVGLSLYWNIFSLFSIMQYRKLKTAQK